MGVRGLTTYIAKNSDKYLDNHLLHDTNLVIDGNNLAAQLYKWHAKCYDCFGGDYDSYAKTITDFFESLKKCNITPIVIFDGSYEDKKLKTIYSRVRSRVKSAQKLNAATENSTQVFPLFLRELFTETVIKLGCKAVRCDFEADYEMACVARTLKCPVLSYDSDFYIFDVLYVPFSTIDFQSKRIKKKDKSFYAIECKLYKIENFLNSLGGMDKTNLPLLAVLLGNDYIQMRVFKNFYSQLKLISRKSLHNEQQRRIETVIRWLQKETYESAARKILGRVKMADRKQIAGQIKSVADGYICSESKLLHYLDISPTEPVEIKQNVAINVEEIPEDAEVEADDTDSKSHTSETSMEIDEGTGIQLDSLSDYFPAWFLQQYRTCNFPAWFVDIAVHNRYFFIPQAENFNSVHSHAISVPLLAALHKILTSGKIEALTYIARNEKASVKNFTLDTSNLNLPTLEEIENSNKETLTGVFQKVLNLEVDVEKLLEKFPADWHVFVLSIVYWVKNCDVKISSNHVYALIMCVIILKVVDLKIGYKRTLKQIQKYESGLTSTPEEGISKRECVNYMKEMIPHFYMDEKMYRNPRHYDIAIVDAFSRFQSCLFHIKYLNKVLNMPYEDIVVSDFYNGAFIYSCYTNLSKRTDSVAYLSNMLNNCTGILTYLMELSGEITTTLNTVTTAAKKRRKKRNRNKSVEEESKVMCIEEEDGEKAEIDVNNQYSILNFV